MRSGEKAPHGPASGELLPRKNERLAQILAHLQAVGELLNEDGEDQDPSVERFRSNTTFQLVLGYKIEVKKADGSGFRTLSNRPENMGLTEYRPGEVFLADSLGVATSYSRGGIAGQPGEVSYCISETSSDIREYIAIRGGMGEYSCRIVDTANPSAESHTSY